MVLVHIANTVMHDSKRWIDTFCAWNSRRQGQDCNCRTFPARVERNSMTLSTSKGQYSRRARLTSMSAKAMMMRRTIRWKATCQFLSSTHRLKQPSIRSAVVLRHRVGHGCGAHMRLNLRLAYAHFVSYRYVCSETKRFK